MKRNRSLNTTNGLLAKMESSYVTTCFGLHLCKTVLRGVWHTLRNTVLLHFCIHLNKPGQQSAHSTSHYVH